MKPDSGILHYASNLTLPPLSVRSFHQLLFSQKSNVRDESILLLGHIGNSILEISRSDLQTICLHVYKQAHLNGLSPGDTVLLARLEACSELRTALLLVALSAYGLRVFLPMYLEPEQVQRWVQSATISCFIIPAKEIKELDSCHHEKEQVSQLEGIASEQEISCFDFQDLPDHRGFLPDPFSLKRQKHHFPPGWTLRDDPEHESLIVTTSGSSGASKLVVYTQGAILKSCLAWETAGLFDKNKMGGRSFTPLISHTMGIRGVFNAIWSGFPVCLINSNYFMEKPEITRYFLMEMKPQNITGGPAVYQMLIELIRLYPELRDGLRKNLTTLVSSGAGFDRKTVEMIEDLFDKPLHNAFGTTENQQVTNTLLSKDLTKWEKPSLGEPLPGVEIELQPLATRHGSYSLHVHSPFMCKGQLVDSNQLLPTDHFFSTRDVVETDLQRQIFYQGRLDEDYFKDGFGVKIPYHAINQYFKNLKDLFNYIHFVPVHAYPGLGLLIFQPENSEAKLDRNGIKHLIKDKNSELKKHLSQFEYNHRHIVAFILIPAPAPLTKKGNVSSHAITESYSTEINLLENLFSHHVSVCLVDDDPDIGAFAEHSNPYLGYLTWAMKANWDYHRASADELYTFREGKEISVIDFVGGYGSGLAGHNHPAIRHAMEQFIRSESAPLSDQFSKHETVGILAKRMENELFQIHHTRYITLFGSTGAEVAEMALHHAYFEWIGRIKELEEEQYRQFADVDGGLVRATWEQNWTRLNKQRVYVVTHHKGYHGLSSGVRSLLGEEARKKPFRGLLAVDSIPVNDLESEWEQKYLRLAKMAVCEIGFLKMDQKQVVTEKFALPLIIASIFEPIIGEGGVRIIDPSLIEYFSRQEFPIIIDEIQTGLGRTGRFLASQETIGDYYLLSKSLGGNFAKIAALCIRKSRFKEKFQKYYLSTFSLGGLAAQCAITTLDVIRNEQVADLAAEKGAYLLDGLNRLLQKYPQFIRRIGGKGLMCGMELQNMADTHMLLMKLLWTHEMLGYLCSSYLLNVHHIRVLPTLSAPETLRFEPSAFITYSQLDRLFEALTHFFDLLESENTFELLKFLMENDPFTDNRNFQPEQGFINGDDDIPIPGVPIVASIIHFAYPTEELRLMDPSLVQASDTALRLLFSRFHAILGGKTFRLSATNVHQNRVHLRVYFLFADSAELEQLQKEGRRNKMIHHIQKAVDIAASEGAEIISLGGYTSIITRNGTQIAAPPNTQVITGNSLTAGMGIQKMMEQIHKRIEVSGEVRIGLVGALGNIGSLITRELLKDGSYSNLILITRHLMKREEIIRRLDISETLAINWNGITLTTQLATLKECDFIVSVSNNSKPIIYPHHIHKGKEVSIIDVSLPSAVSPEVRQLENVTLIPFTAFTSLPHDPNYVISTCIPKGTLFCCIAEALLCALKQMPYKLTGKIEPEAVEQLMNLAKKEGMITGIDPIKTFKI